MSFKFRDRPHYGIFHLSSPPPTKPKFHSSIIKLKTFSLNHSLIFQLFEACFSFAFWIFNTFFTIFCSSTKKARIILKKLLIKTPTSAVKKRNKLEIIYRIIPLPDSTTRQNTSIGPVHSPTVPWQSRPLVFSRSQVRNLQIDQRIVKEKLDTIEAEYMVLITSKHKWKLWPQDSPSIILKFATHTVPKRKGMGYRNFTWKG